MPSDLIDPDDGENRAVRWFLACYGGSMGLTVGAMKRHLVNCGYPFWPEWANEQDREHLTKGGAQDWLRHLFRLETSEVQSSRRARLIANGYKTDSRCAMLAIGRCFYCGRTHDAGVREGQKP